MHLEILLASCYDDPVKFVLSVFPWGKGPLKDEYPRAWQLQYLKDLGAHIRDRNFNFKDAVRPIRFSTVSGHGIGKTCLSAWLILFLHHTREKSVGTVTSNTSKQLFGKTWREVKKWHRMSLLTEMSDCNYAQGNMTLRNKMDHTWKVEAITAEKENADALQGQHEKSSSSFYIMDECSGIDREIFRSLDGGLAHGEGHMHCFGNGLRSSGEFYDQHHRKKSQWVTRSISTLDVFGEDHPWSREKLAELGPESNEAAIRVWGRFPSSATTQLIPFKDLDHSMKRAGNLLYTSRDRLIFGVDVAREGDDRSVIFPRRGPVADGFEHRVDVMKEKDTMDLVERILQRIRLEQPDLVVIDATGVGGPVVDVLQRQPGIREGLIQGVNSSSKSPEPYRANYRAHMYMELKSRVCRREIRLPDWQDLRDELGAIEYLYRKSDNWMQLEAKSAMKSRLGRSPDLADALALTFALPDMHYQPTGAGGIIVSKDFEQMDF